VSHLEASIHWRTCPLVDRSGSLSHLVSTILVSTRDSTDWRPQPWLYVRHYCLWPHSLTVSAYSMSGCCLLLMRWQAICLIYHGLHGLRPRKRLHWKKYSVTKLLNDVLSWPGINPVSVESLSAHSVHASIRTATTANDSNVKYYIIMCCTVCASTSIRLLGRGRGTFAIVLGQ